MKRPRDNRDNDEIARVAQAIWEAEGRPEGRTSINGCERSNS